jgi:LCP family protein required for cell wall assembly
MPSPQQVRPRAKSAFAAAFLSLIFPGLGHAYAGAYQRALIFAAPILLFIALVGGIALRMTKPELAGLVLANLTPLLIVNVVLLIYRGAAIVDAWRVTSFINAYESSGDGRLGRPRVILNPLSIAGLATVLLVMAGAHAVVAKYDLTAMRLVNCVFDENGTASCDETGDGAGASASPGDSGPADSADATPTDAPASPIGSVTGPAPSQTPLPAWNGKDRLNILLIGVDQRPGDKTFNTDTLIVVSIDPSTGHVAMFSLPRDSSGVPVPPGRPQQVWGATYPLKINRWYLDNVGHSELWPGNSNTRGYNALKAILGNLYGLDIRYYVQVNFQGFQDVVDALGGVTINVQNPVIDDNYPGRAGHVLRVYIPAGVQHMDGAEALIYARSRHGKRGLGSDDYDRGARQQRVLLSLREQTNVSAVLPQLDTLVTALVHSVKTDIPPSILPQLLGLADSVDTKNIRSYVFAPPLYGTQGYFNGTFKEIPNVGRIRAAVRDAFTVDPAAEAVREKLAEEAATIFVLNGSGQPGQAANIAGFLDYQGMEASAPNQRPRGSPSTTRIVAYNGAETKVPDTIAYLQQLFGVQVTTATDPNAHADIIVTTARTTPSLTPPPIP